MIDIRKDLIRAELDDAAKPFGLTHRTFLPLKPTNRFIDWLFRRYDLHEMTEHWFDDVFCDGNRLSNLTWIDVVGPGVWNESQHLVNQVARRRLKGARNFRYEPRHCGVSRKDRFYIAFLDEYAYIYCYSRDYSTMDIWWIFVRKNKRKR